MSVEIKGSYKETNLIESVTANGDSSLINLAGDYSIAIYGTFDGATVQFVFMTETAAGTLSELPVSSDFEFTGAPEAQRFSFPEQMPFLIRVSGAGAGTDLSVNAHRIR